MQCRTAPVSQHMCHHSARRARGRNPEGPEPSLVTPLRPRWSSTNCKLLWSLLTGCKLAQTQSKTHPTKGKKKKENSNIAHCEWKGRRAEVWHSILKQETENFKWKNHFELKITVNQIVTPVIRGKENGEIPKGSTWDRMDPLKEPNRPQILWAVPTWSGMWMAGQYCFPHFFPQIAGGGLAVRKVGRPTGHLPELSDCQCERAWPPA